MVFGKGEFHIGQYGELGKGSKQPIPTLNKVFEGLILALFKFQTKQHCKVL